MSRSQTGMPQNRKVDKPPRMNRFPKCRKVVDGGAGREQPFAANGCKELAKPATMGCASAVLLGVLWVLRFFREVERYSRLINEATYPAPNPLSIFTTLTFEAHEFIIPSSAASPLKEAP